MLRLYFSHNFDWLEVEIRIVNQADRSTEITCSGLRAMLDPLAVDVLMFTWECAKPTMPKIQCLLCRAQQTE